MTDILRRALAPITEIAWQELDRQAARLLKSNLSARGLVDFKGPFGLAFAAVNQGRLAMAAEPSDGVGWGLHTVLPLLEARVPFQLRIWDLDDMERGVKNPDLQPLAEAARKMALFEERAIFQGFSAAGIKGLLESSSQAPVLPQSNLEPLTEAVETGLLALHEAGIEGPYALVLGKEHYKGLMIGDPSAYPLRKRVEALATGGIHLSLALTGGALLSRRGGDFELTVGQDLALGYQSHDAQFVHLYVAESFTFQVLDPAAVVALELD